MILNEPLRESTAAVLLTLDRNMRKAERVKYIEKRDGKREYFDIVSSLRKQKNGEKFKKLYDEGDISEYGSHSEADAALCAMIAFRTGPDNAAIDRIFRSSALYREKWERDDYREATINAGIEACHGIFHKSKMDHRTLSNSTKTERLCVRAPPGEMDTGAFRLYPVRDNGRQALLIYVYEDGCYQLYAPDMLKGVIKKYIAEYDEELVSMGKVNEAYNQIITDLNYAAQEDLNSDELLINFQNCLLRVDTEEILQHTPAVLSTIQIPCRWTGKPTPTPVFDDFLHTLTNGNKATQQLLLEFIGACISNIKGWRMKKSLFMVGEGDTGKSQLKSLVERLLGKGNFIGIDLKDIEARFGTGAIYGTRLAGSSDMSFMSVDELKTFKSSPAATLYAEFRTAGL